MLIMNINIKNLALICRYTNQPLSSILQISQMFRGTICEDPFLQHVKYILQKRQTTAKTFYWYETAKDNDPQLETITKDFEQAVKTPCPFVLETLSDTNKSNLTKKVIDIIYKNNSDKINISDFYPKYDLNKKKTTEWVKIAAKSASNGLSKKDGDIFTRFINDFEKQITYISFREFYEKGLNLYTKTIKEIKDKGNKIIIVFYGAINKSAFWVLLLFWDVLSVCDGVEYGWDGFVDWKNSKTGHDATTFIVIDDAIYSGSQMSQDLEKSFMYGPCWTFGDEIILSPVYMSINADEFKDITMSFGNKVFESINTLRKYAMFMHSVGRIRVNDFTTRMPALIDTIHIAEKLNDYPPIYEIMAGHNTLTATYFQHKLADAPSTIQTILGLGVYNEKKEGEWVEKKYGPLINGCKKKDYKVENGEIIKICPTPFYKTFTYKINGKPLPMDNTVDQQIIWLTGDL